MNSVCHTSLCFLLLLVQCNSATKWLTNISMLSEAWRISNVILYQSLDDSSVLREYFQNHLSFCLTENSEQFEMAVELASMAIAGQTMVVVNDISSLNLDVMFAKYATSKNLYWIFHRKSNMPSDTVLRLDSNVFIMDTDSQSGAINVTEKYAIRHEKVIEKHLLTVHPTDGLDWLDVPYKWERRTNLTGVTIRNVYILMKRSHIPNPDHEPSELPFKGAFMDVIQAIRDQLGFEMEFIHHKKRNWGKKDENGTWTGLIRVLLDKQADISTSGITLVFDRTDVADASFAVREKRASFVKQRKRVSAINMGAFVMLFHIWSWFWIAILTLIFWIFFLCSPRMDTKDKGTVFIMIFSSFIQRDHSHHLYGLSSKITFITMSLFTFLIFVHYTSLLVSLMTFNTKTIVTETFQDILDQDMELTVFPNTFFDEYLKNSNKDTVQNKVYQKMLKQDYMYPNDVDQALEWLNTNPRSVFFSFDNNFVLTGNLERKIVPNQKVFYDSFFFQKDSEFTEIFNYHLNRLREAGILTQTWQKWKYFGNPETILSAEYPIEDGVVAGSLGYENLLFPFALLICCGIISVVIVLLEFIFAKILATYKVSIYFISIQHNVNNS